MTTNIELIKQLHTETGAGIMECRRALEENNYQAAPALIALREWAAAQALKRAERQATQGMLELYAHANGRIGVMVEVNCETDFAAKSAAFRQFAHEIALQIAAAAPRWVRAEEIPAEVLNHEREKVAEQARASGKPEALLPRITEGYMKKFMEQTVLLRQASIRDETVTVAQLLTQVSAAVRENIVIRRFQRWELEETAQE
jgi:elongation factor Ts